MIIILNLLFCSKSHLNKRDSESFSNYSFRYVGNLEPTITDELLYALFGQIGEVKGCKIINEV